MQEKKKMAQDGKVFWVGLDWGESEHAVSVVDSDRQLQQQFTCESSLEDLRRLSARLHALGTVAGIAIESTVNPVFTFLASEGFTLYPINPKLSKNWREGSSVAGVKSDLRDGLMLALELSRRHESLRAFKKTDPDVAELAGLCETVCGLVGRRTALVQQLRAALRAYYPAALEFFSDFTSPSAWHFVKRYPGPENLARSRKDALIGFLKKNKVGMTPLWQERIERRIQAAEWPQPENHLALEQVALSAAAGLHALRPYIQKCEKLIAERVKGLEISVLLFSLPGAGPRLAPAMTAMVALTAEEPEPLWALRCLSGVAPVQHESGKMKRTKMRRRCNKHWRNTLHQFAACSKQYCAWAKAFYDLRKSCGDGHATALRKLADKWLKIIHRMIESGECYDDSRYVEALRKSGSPVWGKLCG